MKNLKTVLSIIFIIIIITGIGIGKNNTYSKHSQTEFVLDTICTIEVWDKNMKKSADCIEAAFDEVKRIESLTSYFIQDSDVNRINSAKAGEAVAVSDDIREIIAASLEIAEKSGGVFDITIASVMDLWNFKDTVNTSVPKQEDIDRELENVGYRGLQLVDSGNGAGGAVIKNRDGIKIDLGGVAKGYAADMAVKTLKNMGIKKGIVDLGGNIVVFGDDEFSVGIQKPFAARGEYVQVVKVKNMAVVTSGVYERNFTVNDKLYHHILDTVTGYPVEGDINAVSIVSSSGMYADAISTAAFVIGSEDRERAEKLAFDYGCEIYFE